MINNLFLSKIDELVKRKVGFKKDMAKYIEDEAQSIIDGINNSNNNTLKSLDILATKISTLREKMAEASENTLTVSSLSGNSNTQFFLSDSIIDEMKDVVISGNNLSLSSSIKDVHQIFDIDVYTNGSLGNSADYDEKRYYEKGLITTNSHLEIESFNSGVSATITINLRSTKVSNVIEFNYKEFGINAPSVGRVEYSKDGIEFREAATNVSVSKDKISILFSDSEVKVIRFTVSQSDGYVAKNSRKRFPIGMYNLKIGIQSSVESGYVVLGPFSSYREIIKASIGCSIPNDGYSLVNTKFEISHDKNRWIELSAPYAINDKLKVVDYNTISDNAIKTPYEVKALFLKINLTGEKISKTYSYNSAYNKHTQTVNTTQPSVFLPFDFTEESIVGVNSGVSFGEKVTYTTWADKQSEIDSIESIRVNDNYITKSLAPMDSQIKVTIKYPLCKCNVEKSDNFKIYPMRSGDIYSSKFYRLSEPVIRKQRISTSNNVVIPFKQVAGIYTLTDGKIYRKIDLTSGYFTSCYQWAYKEHDSNVSLISPIGEEVFIFEAEKPISLLDYFEIEEIKQSEDSPVSISFNKEYPHKALDHNEFTLINGSIVSGSENGIVDAYTSYSREIDVNTEFGVGSVIFTADDVSMIKTSENLLRFDGKNIAKLNKTGIVKGSLRFDYSNASIFSFVEEVDFINGIEEFNTGNKVEIQIPANVNSFSLGNLVDHFSDIKFIGYSSVFTNRVFSEYELINRGDYMLKDISKSETIIVLPKDIYTHDIINTKAVIDIPIDSVGNGYFSVDYNNGIIYSQTKIDGNTIVEYISSNIYMSGKELDYIPKSKYNVSGRTIQFNSISDDTSITVVSKMSEIYKLDIYKSPMVKDLTLNTVVV